MLRIQQELTTRCTCNCLFCPREVIGTNRTLGDISLEMSELVIQRYTEIEEPFTVSVSGFGEPLLYPALQGWLQDVRHRCPNARIELNTNATHLDRRTSKWLIELVDEVQFSLNMPFEENFKLLKGCDYKRVRENIEAYYEIKGEGKPVSDIRILRNKYTDVMEAVKEWSPMLPRGDAVRVADFENWMGLIDEEKWGVAYDKPDNLIFICKDVQGKHITITKEGDAYACCFSVALPEKHPFTLGNIRDKPIQKLLDSQWRNVLEAMHKAKKYLDACSNCSVLRVIEHDGDGFAGTRYMNPDESYVPPG